MEKGLVMHERLWTFLFGISLVVLGGCGTVTAINFIAAGDNGSGFLQDLAVCVMGLGVGGAVLLCVLSRRILNRLS